MGAIVIGKSGVAYSGKIGGGVIAGINETNLLLDGAIAVFTDKSELVTAANVGTILADKKGIFIAVGSGSATTGSYVSQVTRRLGTNYVKKAYITPVKEVKLVGYNGTNGSLNLPTLIAGAEAFIRIVDNSKGFRHNIGDYSTDIKSYSYVIKTGDTDTIIVNNIVNQINNDPQSIVVAAVVGTTPNLGISLTAKNFGTTFQISLDGLFVNSTKTEGGLNGSVAIVYGEGTSDQVLALEDLASAERGNTNKIWQSSLWYSVPSKVVGGSTYDQYSITWTPLKVRAADVEFSLPCSLQVAIPSGATQQATFETIMAQVFGVAEDEETGA